MPCPQLPNHLIQTISKTSSRWFLFSATRFVTPGRLYDILQVGQHCIGFSEEPHLMPPLSRQGHPARFRHPQSLKGVIIP